jgi:tetrahydromethanopterin S-methyltransferase subunit E
MTKTISAVLAAAFVVASQSPAGAASKKETDCGHQAAVVSAVQQARLARVSERKVEATVLAGEVTWPERYNAAIPLFAAEVYKLKMRDIKAVDLGAQWKATCLAS